MIWSVLSKMLTGLAGPSSLEATGLCDFAKLSFEAFAIKKGYSVWVCTCLSPHLRFTLIESPPSAGHTETVQK